MLAYSIGRLNCISPCLYLGSEFEFLVLEISTFRLEGETSAFNLGMISVVSVVDDGQPRFPVSFLNIVLLLSEVLSDISIFLFPVYIFRNMNIC